jgi:hypothetical protein
MGRLHVLVFLGLPETGQTTKNPVEAGGVWLDLEAFSLSSAAIRIPREGEFFRHEPGEAADHAATNDRE